MGRQVGGNRRPDLGRSLPAAVGIALAGRDSGRNRPVIAVIGEGSFQYSPASAAGRLCAVLSVT